MVTSREAIKLLWQDGNLSWLLHTAQKDIYDNWHNDSEKIAVWNCSRRLGKSFLLCVIAIECCLKKKNSLVKYTCSKQTDARGIIRPLIREIIETCPKELKPDFRTQERAYIFPNGSRLEISGLDNNRAEGLRGGSVHLGIVDEAGLVSDLHYIVTSILLPTTLTTKGKIILASTPPRSSAHSFVDYVSKARINGNLITKTIYDNPLIDQLELQKIVEDNGGISSVTFRREFLCEIILDQDFAIVPEFDAETKSAIVREWPRASFYDGYVSMDLGLKDLTVALFAWYDFRASKLIIEDELVMNGTQFNTHKLAQAIKQKEEEVYGNTITSELKEPYLRVSDNNLIVINDLWHLHGLRFFPTKKDDSMAALNEMKIAIQNQDIIINPKCKTLILHLESGVWNKSKKSYDRSPDKGHYDAIDALKYLVRNIQASRNPYPADFSGGSFHYADTPSLRNNNGNDTWKKIFNLTKINK
jgi:hypothetical protein